MSAAALPPPDKVLRKLFWRLLFRGRAAQQMGAQKTRRQVGLGVTLIMYAFIGIMPAVFARDAECFVFASILHGFTFMFASLSLASNAGTMLFMKEEAEILLHRPVTPQQMLRAKCTVLAGFALLLALALNLAGIIAGVRTTGATWRFVPAHLFSTALLMLFSAASIVLVYNACLKWLGRDRFDNLLASLQSLLAILMVISGQVMPRLMTSESLKHADQAGGWLWVMPPTWFGALDALIGGSSPDTSVLWLPAALGVGVTALTCWVALEKLGDAYGRGLMGLNESTGRLRKSGSKPLGCRLAALVRLPPLSWWLADPVEREAFKLTTAYLLRDREVKMRLYPGIAPVLIMPLVMTFTGRPGGAGEATVMLQGFATCFLGMVPLQAMMFLACSEQWRASTFFHAAPLTHWTPLFHGSRKAVLVCLAFPVLALQTVILCVIQRSVAPLALSLPAVLFLPAFSLITGIIGPWLPFSKPSEEVKNTASGCLMMAGTMIAAGTIGGLAGWMWHIGHFAGFLVLEGIAMLGAAVLMKHLMRDTPWLAPTE